MFEPDELKSLPRLRPSDDFKASVHARLRVPEPRPMLWPLPMAAAAGILIGVLGTMQFLQPTAPPALPPVVAASPALTETIRDHAHRTRTFISQTDRTPPELMEADYRISGLGPRTETLLAEPVDRLPESEQMYIEAVARPVGDVVRLMDERRRGDAVDALRALRDDARFNNVLFDTPSPEPARMIALTVSSIDGPEMHVYLQARSCMYERAFGPARERFGYFARRFPDSTLEPLAIYGLGNAALADGDMDGGAVYLADVLDDGLIDDGERRYIRFLSGDRDRPNALLYMLTEMDVRVEGDTMIFRGEGGPEIREILRRAHEFVEFDEDGRATMPTERWRRHGPPSWDDDEDDEDEDEDEDDEERWGPPPHRRPPHEHR